MAGLGASGLTAAVSSWGWIGQNLGLISAALLQHLRLSALAIGIGFAVSLPLALIVWRVPGLRRPVLAVAAVFYTVPSIALFVLIQPLTGYYSTTTAEVALSGYTLLILIRNTVVGLEAVPEEIREAARAMGYSPLRSALLVELPLAAPAIFAGLRVAVVTVVGLVTVAAFVGQGGLGQLVIQGFELAFPTEIWVALLLSIALAAAGDAFFVVLERLVAPWSHRRRGGGR